MAPTCRLDLFPEIDFQGDRIDSEDGSYHMTGTARSYKSTASGCCWLITW
jgi:hypothetical protein